MTEKLLRLIERAKQYQMTPGERREQAIRFAYGNAHYENDQITMELVADALRAHEQDRNADSPRSDEE